MAKRGYLYYILLLAALGTCVLNTVREGVEFSASMEEKKSNLRKRQLMEERYLAVTKNVWPECVNLKLSAEACKDFVDNEIYNLFTDRDRYIRSLIIGKRRKTDKLYNAVSILMDDGDMVEGRDGDGKVYYDFTWDGSGEMATDEQQAALPPIVAMEPTVSLYSITGVEPPATGPPVPAPTPDVVVSNDDVVVLEEAPLVILDEPIEGVIGSTIDQFITAEPVAPPPSPEGGTAAPIAGGVLTDGTAENTQEGDVKIQDALSQDLTIVESAGERVIEPIDCAGLTGQDCCLLVKLTVRDSNINGDAIQCTLNYVETSEKKKYWQNHRGKTVRIFSNHNYQVSKVPKIVGDWPKGYTQEEFEQWLLEGGAPPLILQ